MRRLLAVALLVPVMLLASEKPAETLNTLTPKEIADGWLLLFDGETTFGWTVDGDAKAEKGVLVAGGARETTVEPTVRLPRSMGVSVEVDWRGEKPPRLTSLGAELGTYDSDVLLLRKEQGKFATQYVSGTSTGGPRTPMRFVVPAGSTLLLRNAKARPTQAEPLFNGKDLAGWKVFQGEPKREKSQWSVTKEGWLNVKDGPGDLQTEALYDDFVLQLECRSNGKHLNSGVFFRCLPGQYQQGYEAQVRNQFTENPTQKYNVEEYDPKTHKLLGKKVVESTAVDFGTGAIYRRVPARKGIAKDGEWFTMTVVARGRHIATWVDGVQVVDWTDNRPEKESAREGYRGTAGAISIQGHDPTTDLSFRNIRVAKLPR